STECGLDRSEEFGFRDHRGEGPSRKRQRRERDLVGRTSCGNSAAPGVPATFLSSSGERQSSNRQQALLAADGMQFVGFIVRRSYKLARTIKDKCRPRAPHFQLGQKPRQPRVFDDDRKNALTLLVHINRSGKGDRGTLSRWMVDHLEPLRLISLDARLEPGL